MPVTVKAAPGGGVCGGGGGGGLDGAVTSIARPMLLFWELSSGSCDVANSVCPVIATPAVFQGISTMIDAPTGRPFTVPVPAVGPAHPSVSRTVKVPTSTSPTFCTVIRTCAVSPWATERGPVAFVNAISVGLGVTVKSSDRRLLAPLSAEIYGAARGECPPCAAPVFSHGNTSYVLLP